MYHEVLIQLSLVLLVQDFAGKSFGLVEMNGWKRLGRGLWEGGASEQRGRDGTASLLHDLEQGR